MCFELYAERVEEKRVEESQAAPLVEERKPYRRCRLREHYTCIDTHVSLDKSDVVDVLDTRREPMWLVRHAVHRHKVVGLLLVTAVV